MALWLSSDHHFFHKNVLSFCKRPFRDLEHMHEELIRRHNERVRPDDTWICVGDFSFGPGKGTEEVLSRMNGFKILVCGNHDKRTTQNKFDLCVNEMTVVFAGQPVTIKHYPLRWGKWSHLRERFMRWLKKVPDPKYMERRDEDKGQLHIHGHTHSDEKFNKNQIHVGVDAWEYYPVSGKELMKRISSYMDKKGK
jgi:calcineurin-like phosphoesterase family protein